MKAQIQFLHSGADGTPLLQAFRFLDTDVLLTLLVPVVMLLGMRQKLHKRS